MQVLAWPPRGLRAAGPAPHPAGHPIQRHPARCWLAAVLHRAQCHPQHHAHHELLACLRRPQGTRLPQTLPPKHWRWAYLLARLRGTRGGTQRAMPSATKSMTAAVIKAAMKPRGRRQGYPVCEVRLARLRSHAHHGDGPAPTRLRHSHPPTSRTTGLAKLPGHGLRAA